jgi:hypothetical protein
MARKKKEKQLDKILNAYGQAATDYQAEQDMISEGGPNHTGCGTEDCCGQCGSSLSEPKPKKDNSAWAVAVFALVLSAVANFAVVYNSSSDKRTISALGQLNQLQNTLVSREYLDKELDQVIKVQTVTREMLDRNLDKFKQCHYHTARNKYVCFK